MLEFPLQCCRLERGNSRLNRNILIGQIDQAARCRLRVQPRRSVLASEPRSVEQGSQCLDSSWSTVSIALRQRGTHRRMQNVRHSMLVHQARRALMPSFFARQSLLGVASHGWEFILPPFIRRRSLPMDVKPAGNRAARRPPSCEAVMVSVGQTWKSVDITAFPPKETRRQSAICGVRDLRP